MDHDNGGLFDHRFTGLAGAAGKNSYSVEQRRSQLGCQPNIYICISPCLYCCAYIIQTLSSEGTAEVYLAVQ